MSGRLSTLWNVVSSVPVIMGAFASGYISEHLPPKETFFVGGGTHFADRPTGSLEAVFGLSATPMTSRKPRGADFLGDVKRLVKHRAIYPAVLICFLWNFAPGAATPLQFYLTNKLHASDAVYSYYNGIFAVSFIPTFLLYGVLCKKVALKKLLWWGTIVAVPQMIPLAFIHSGNLALVLAVPIGLMGGVATAAYFDLAIRSCPPGLQGTLMMLVDGVFALSARGGDLLGSRSITAAHAWISLLRDCDDHCVRADPAADPAGAERTDRHRGRAIESGDRGGITDEYSQLRSLRSRSNRKLRRGPGVKPGPIPRTIISDNQTQAKSLV